MFVLSVIKVSLKVYVRVRYTYAHMIVGHGRCFTGKLWAPSGASYHE